MSEKKKVFTLLKKKVKLRGEKNFHFQNIGAINSKLKKYFLTNIKRSLL